MKDKILKYWPIFLFLGGLVYHFGYLSNELDAKIGKDEVTEIIKETLQQYDKSQKEKLENQYIKIEKIPGLVQTLDNINEKLDDISKRFDKLENRFYQLK